MGNVGSFKARISLETEEYLAGWKKVEQATSSSVSSVGKAFEKAGKTWSKSMEKAFIGFFGIQLADTLVKSIDERMKNPLFEGIGANIAYAVGEGFAKTLESVPVAGTVGKWIGAGIGTATDYIGLTSDASGGQEERQQASRVESERRQNALTAVSEITNQMDRQRALAEAVTDAERTRLERQFKFQDISRRINDEMKKGKFGPQEIIAARDRAQAAYDAQNAAQDKLAASKAAQLENEKAILEAQQAQARAAEEAAKVAEAAERRAADRRAAEERAEEAAADFLIDMQRRLDERTMTEDQLFQRKLDELDLDDEQVRRAWELHEALKAAEEVQTDMADTVEETEPARAISNVESIGTAVGAVRVAGVTSGLDKLADPTKQTAANTAKLVELAYADRMAGSAP